MSFHCHKHYSESVKKSLYHLLSYFFSPQRSVVNQLKSDMEKIQEEIKAQLVSICYIYGTGNQLKLFIETIESCVTTYLLHLYHNS